ncbi:MAG TPA: AMP-binding protein, partial [Methanothrix soehngenii]|nr:AMP-binding protein [Methanothrix soehngenii]
MQLQALFLETARRLPQKVAVVDRSQGRRLTYTQMLVASLMLSRSMKRWGGGQETFLGILLPNSAGAIIAFMASLMAGRVPVLINYATGATENVAYARKRCGFRTVLTARALLDKLQLEPDEGMIFLEDILGELKVFDKIRGLVKSK